MLRRLPSSLRMGRRLGADTGVLIPLQVLAAMCWVQFHALDKRSNIFSQPLAPNVIDPDPSRGVAGYIDDEQLIVNSDA